MSWKKIVGLLLVGVGLTVLALQLGHYYDLAPVLKKWSAKAGPTVAKTVDRIQPKNVVYILLVALPVCAGALFLLASKSKSVALVKAAPEQPVVVHRPAKTPARQKVYHSCNVLQFGSDSRQIWQFDARNSGFVLNRQQVTMPGEQLPSRLVAKDLRSLFQRNLNVAWLPPENVFFRVIQLPHSEVNETLAMVELQLEKLSPLPVAQVVWSVQILPHTGGNMQTAVVTIVARNVVEEFLGQLEGQGYLADRLELPVLDQLSATAINEDGAWIYPEALGSRNAALVAWWYGGVLQNLDFVSLSSGKPDAVQEQLTQMAWAGEMEGWLKSPPHWHLVASGPAAAEWETALRKGLDQPLQVLEPLPAPQLAAATARRATQATESANLLPAEFAERYKQQFIDRLWMRGLLGMGAVYLIGVLIYGGFLGFALYQTTAVENKRDGVANEYTNTMQLKATYLALKERQELKFAALDCWKAIAELMPETLSLESWNFGGGKRLTLNGTAPSNEQVPQISEFEKAVRKQSLFDSTKGDYLRYNTVNNGVRWDFSVELKRSEAQ